jgi:hypothetical protein
MTSPSNTDISSIVGRIPYRLALAGGWIDQPTVSQHNPSPPGSMVTVQVQPEFRFMDRAGICGSTRRIAMDIWQGQVPADRDKMELVRELYRAENEGLDEPSGSQDMIGLVYPGINRLDYDFAVEGGYFPRHIESNNDPEVAAWLGSILYLVPVNQRPDGYNPLTRKNLDPVWIERLGQTGQRCFDAIVRRDLDMLGQSFNDCMACWEAIFPDTVDHPTLNLDLRALLALYQQRYPGAMYSGCGGGYLYIVSETPVPGGFQVTIRTDNT